MDSNLDFSSLENSWYLPFFKLLTENCGKDDLKDRFQSVSLIIFNYDRCIEHFLCCALQSYYRISMEEAADTINHISIYHPYGTVGSLPWNSVNTTKGIKAVPMEFGADPSPQDLLELVDNIKTFTEGTDRKSSEIIEIRKHMRTADRTVFIGFAFHKLNMQLIESENVKRRPPRCYATTHKISESDRAIIRGQIASLYPGVDPRMADLTCAKFFVDFWRSLSF